MPLQQDSACDEAKRATSLRPTLYATERPCLLKSALKWLFGYRLAIILIWLAAICLVDPRGNFALDDDWVYAAAVKHLVTTGHYRLPWSSVSLLTEALWGALFCKLFGFSFVTLRWSILVLGIAGLVAFYETILLLRIEPLLAFLGTLTVMFTPFFFNLSFTFMTDGFFCSCIMISVLLLLRNQETHSRRDLALGMCMALIATLTRQLGLCIPLAWAIARTVERPKGVKAWVTAWAPVALIGGALLAYMLILKALGEMPSRYNPQGAFAVSALRHPKILLHALTSAIPEILIYLGLFIAPALPALWYTSRRNPAVLPRSSIAVCTLWVVCITPVLLRLHKRIPFRGSTLEDFRLGNYFDANLPSLPSFVWYALTAAGILGACSIIVAIAVMIARNDAAIMPDLAKRRLRFLLLTVVIYFIPVFLVNDYLDRYVLPAIPLSLLALFLISNQGDTAKITLPKGYIITSFTLLAGIALFSILGTRDYLTYYRTAWEARRFVVSQGVPPPLAFNVPDWGPAYFDGEYLNDDEMYMNGPVPHADSGYNVGTSVKPGYEVVRQYPFQLKLNRRELTMYVSKREAR